MINPGQVVVLKWETGKLYYVTIKGIYGAIKKEGWLCTTEEGNFVLVSNISSAVARVRFILDEEVFWKYYYKAHKSP